MKILISGCAGHYLYLLGLIRGLQIRGPDFFDFKKVNEIHAYSSGCVVALLAVLNIDINYAMKNLQDNILLELNDCITGSAFNFLRILQKQLLLFLNSISKEIYKEANNKLFLYISYFTFSGLSSEIISVFNSNEDLVDCCIASGFVPIYHVKPVFYYRGRYCVDYAIGYKPPADIKYNFKRDSVRDLTSVFGSYIFITSNYKKSRQMYETGILDSKFLLKFQC